MQQLKQQYAGPSRTVAGRCVVHCARAPDVTLGTNLLVHILSRSERKKQGGQLFCQFDRGSVYLFGVVHTENFEKSQDLSLTKERPIAM